MAVAVAWVLLCVVPIPSPKRKSRLMSCGAATVRGSTRLFNHIGSGSASGTGRGRPSSEPNPTPGLGLAAAISVAYDSSFDSSRWGDGEVGRWGGGEVGRWGGGVWDLGVVIGVQVRGYGCYGCRLQVFRCSD